MKRFISILLSIIITFSITAVAYATTVNTEEANSVLIDISTNRSSYSTLGIATVTVKVKNSGVEPIDNVSVETIFSGLSPIGRNSNITCESDSLPAGSELSYSFKCIVNSNNLSVFQRIIQTFITLFSKRLPVSDTGFNDGRDYISADKTINFGSIQATIGVNVYAGNSGKEFNDFYTDKIDVLVGKTESVTFFADINSQTIIDKVSVYDENDSFIGNLYDDGNHNDKQANDGMFANSFSLSSAERVVKDYYAVFDEIKSKKTSVSFYKNFSNGELTAQTTVINGINDIRAKYVISDNDNENITNSKKCYNELKSYLDLQKQNGKIVSYTVLDSEFEVVLLGNVTYDVYFDTLLISPSITTSSYEEQLDTASSTLKAAKLSSNNNTNKQVITLEPCSTVQSNSFDNAARKVANSGNGYAFSKNLDTTSVTLDVCKNLYKYDIIIINSHGGQDGFLIGDIYTGHENDSKYTADLQAGRLSAGTGSGEQLAQFSLRPRFFTDYFRGEKRLNNSLFWIDACRIAEGSMPQAIVDSGAKAVCAYKNSVYGSYSDALVDSVFSNLCQLKTLGQSVSAAKEEHGSVDPTRQAWYWWLFDNESFSNPAELEIIGDSSYTLRMSEIAGTVIDAETNEYISNAKVSVKKSLHSIGSQQSDANGNYSITVNPGTYSVTISAYGYISRTIDNVVVEPDQTTYLSASTLIKSGDGKGIVGGKLINSINGSPVANATIKFRNKHGILSGMYVLNGITPLTITTNENGEFYCDTLSRGYYSLEASKEGFVTESTDVIAGTNTKNQRATITPELPEGQYRIVLTWGAYPSDLDSHLTGKTSSGSSFHVYFNNKNAWDGDINVANLDVDDTSSYGPETITLNPTTTETYKYYVYNYSGNGSASISTSFAQVKLYKGNALIATYNAPTDQGTDRYWTVFEITNGTVKNINKIASSVQ